MWATEAPIGPSPCPPCMNTPKTPHASRGEPSSASTSGPSGTCHILSDLRPAGGEGQCARVGGPVDARQRAPAVVVYLGRPTRAAQRRAGARGLDQDDVVAVAEDQAGRAPLEVLDQPERPHDGRGVDVAAAALVVEADVAPDDGDFEGPARLRHAVYGLGQLPHHLRVLRVPEVEAVDQGDRLGPDAGDVEG